MPRTKKKSSKKRGSKKARKKTAHKRVVASTGAPIALLHKMDKKLTRIDNRLVPKRVRERAARMSRSKDSEAALAAKYG